MSRFKSALLKFGYGYDVSGEIGEGGGTSGQDKSLDDSEGPGNQHKTGPNPANVLRDSDAEIEFPEIAPKPNIFPSRGR